MLNDTAAGVCFHFHYLSCLYSLQCVQCRLVCSMQHCSLVHCMTHSSAVQCSVVQCSEMQCSVLQCGIVQLLLPVQHSSAVQRREMWQMEACMHSFISQQCTLTTTIIWNITSSLSLSPGLRNLLQPCNRAARKWRENEEIKRKWRDYEEIERKWRESEEMECETE